MPPGISLAKASEMAAELRKVVREFPEVVLHRHRISAATTTAPIRGRRRTSRPASGCVPTTPGRRAATKQDLIRRMHGALPPSCRASRSPSASRSSTASPTRCSTRTASSSVKDVRRRLQRAAPHRQGHRRRARRPCPAPPTSLDRSGRRRCRRSRSRSIARRRRATASTSPTSPT